MTPGTAVDVRDVWFAYPGSDPCLAALDLQAEPGELVGILGRTGAGKSTLLRLLAGALQPDRGTIQVAGRTLTRLGDGYPSVGYLMQFPERQFFAHRVSTEVAFGARMRRPSAPDADLAAQSALRAVGLGDGAEFKDRSPWTLSVAEQRRVALASALSFEPQVLLLDEPAASLDGRSRSDLDGALRRFCAAAGTAVAASQDADWVLRTADRTYLLHVGRLRAVDLGDGGSRDALGAAGFLVPAAWRFFERRIEGFWSAGLWRRAVEDLADGLIATREPGGAL
jgi:energy-coupling factor transporter ATP-binding protein EcfA2